MVVGDVVNGIAAAGVVLTFQPAVSIECCITSAMCSNAWTMLTNDVTQAELYHGTWNNANSSVGSNEKIMINNTNYLTILAGNQSSFSGIQIK